CGARRLFRCLRLGSFQPQGIQIFLGNSCEALIRCNGVASSKTLGDHTLCSSRDRRFPPARNLDRLAITTQCEFGVLVHGIKIEELSCHRWRKMANSFATLNPLIVEP